MCRGSVSAECGLVSARRWLATVLYGALEGLGEVHSGVGCAAVQVEGQTACEMWGDGLVDELVDAHTAQQLLQL